jgi:hypothetical protein
MITHISYILLFSLAASQSAVRDFPLDYFSPHHKSCLAAEDVEKEAWRRLAVVVVLS